MDQKAKTVAALQKNIAASEKERKKVRFQFGLQEFCDGKEEILKNDEFVAELIVFFSELTEADDENLQPILHSLKKCSQVEDIVIRERAVSILPYATIAVIHFQDVEAISIVSETYLDWLAFETEMLPVFTVINKHLENLLDHTLSEELYEQAEKMFQLLSYIQSGKIKKSGAIKAITGKILTKFQTRDVIELLTDNYIINEAKRAFLGNILIALGEKAAVYLLNRMINSHSRKERLLLVELLPSFGSVAVPALLECVENDPPWAVVRNIIIIFSGIDDDINFQDLEKFLKHPDERVQHEMVRYIVSLGSNRMQDRLHMALQLVNDGLKIHVIRLLLDQKDNSDKTFEAIKQLAGQRRSFAAATGYELLCAIISALKWFPRSESVLLLEQIAKDYKKIEGFEQIGLLVSEALSVLTPKLRHQRHDPNTEKEDVFFDTDPIAIQSAQEKIRTIEDNVEALLNSGDQVKAGELIYDQAVSALQEKNYPVAEKLRDRLLQVNPMALSEVIELGEMIDGRKSSTITSHHLEVWNELYEEMATPEFNGLYYSLWQQNYNENDTIVRSGEADNNLYFLSSGYVSMSCFSAGNEVFLKRLQPGDIIGSEHFFAASIWTVTLKAMSEVVLHVLSFDKWLEIKKEFPGIEKKLRVYSSRYDKVSELLKMSWEDRREFPRHDVSLLTNNTLLDTFGQKGKRSLKGQLLNISRGGLSFIIKISTLENARKLLGRQVISAITLGEREIYKYSGVVVAVRVVDRTQQDYSVHVRLSKNIDKAELDEIITLGK